MSVNSKMTAIADAIREKTGESGTLTLDGMAAAIEGISAGGGGGAVTSGTITPLAPLTKIEHGLGEKPKAFIWLTTFNGAMTGRDMEYSSISSEQAYDSADIQPFYPYRTRMVFFLIGDYFYSYSIANTNDWGFFTKASVSGLQADNSMSINESEFSFVCEPAQERTIIPYDNGGNVTVHWFAIGGAE